MIILILFAFIGGIITILSPCILPILPIVLSGSVTGGKKRPLGIVTGFILSFTFFTLFLSTLVKATGIPAETLRYIAIVLLIIFGASLLIPSFQIWMEKLFSKLSTAVASRTNKKNTSQDFLSGIPMGASLGLIWTPCVGPILASVITLAATSQVNGAAIAITLAYSLGTSIPLFAILYGGRQLLNKVPWLFSKLERIQKVFGVIMIITAIGIFYNIDRKIQTAILTTFPEYGTGLTAIEDNDFVKQAIKQLTNNDASIDTMKGKPMNDITNPIVPGSSLQKISRAPGFTKKSGEWINIEPLTIEGLKGKVVLVDFWTYTCINCIRTIPYLRTWHEKYSDQGLVIVGVHTPEFEFEKSLDNVQKAVNDFKLTYPIVQDNDFGIWREYANRYWPAKYLIDKDGYIRYTHFGEGDYDETEQAIQELLKEAGSTVNEPINNPSYSVKATTHELYLGANRISYIVSPEKILLNQPQTFSSPDSVPQDRFAYKGTWTLSQEYAKPQEGSSLHLTFGAKEVFLVMKPTAGSTSGKIKILLNGQEVPATQAGEDVINGIVTVSDNRLYKLINLAEPGNGTLTIEFLDDSVELFAFTFG